MKPFDSIIEELQDKMQDEPGEGLRNRVLHSAKTGVKPSTAKRRITAYPILVTLLVLFFTGGAAYAAHELGVFEPIQRLESVRRFERFPSHLDREPNIPQDGMHWVNWEWRDFQAALQAYGWERINAGEIHEGPVPEALWCLCGNPIYMRSRFHGEWGWRPRVYISDEGIEYIEMTRSAGLSFICYECDEPDTARYSIMFVEHAWFDIASLNNPYIDVNRLQIVDSKIMYE